MIHKNEDGMDIPDFLKVANRNKPLPKKLRSGLPKPRQAEPFVDPVVEAGLEPETEALLRQEIAAHRFMLHWLRDPTTILVFERTHQLRKAKQEKKAEEKMVERKIARNVKASLHREFGLDIKIIVLNRNPKRQAGAARIPRFASLLEYLDKNPNASVAEIFRSTEYIKADFLRDQRLKIIKTDIISAPKKGK